MSESNCPHTSMHGVHLEHRRPWPRSGNPIGPALWECDSCLTVMVEDGVGVIDSRGIDLRAAHDAAPAPDAVQAKAALASTAEEILRYVAERDASEGLGSIKAYVGTHKAYLQDQARDWLARYDAIEGRS